MINETIVREGVGGIIDALIDHQVHYGAGFTCSEAEAFHVALVDLGLDEAAHEFMCVHAESDDANEGDIHIVTEIHPNGCAAAWSLIPLKEE